MSLVASSNTRAADLTVIWIHSFGRSRLQHQSCLREQVIRGIGNAEVFALTFTGSLRKPTFGIDAQDGDSIGQNALVAVVNHFKLQPWNIVCSRRGSARDNPSLHCATI